MTAPFEGTITVIYRVTGVFGAPTDITLIVDGRPGVLRTPDAPCADQIYVHLAASTIVAWSDAPNTAVSPDQLVTSQKVRVLPPDGPLEGCKPRIEATSIVIVRLQP